MDDAAIDRLDSAIVHLRRLWSGPPQPLGADARDIDMSSVLLLEAWAQLVDQPGGAVGVGELGRFAAVRPSTATRLIDRAVVAGLLRRVQVEGDARQRFVTATDEGLAVRRRAVMLRTDWLRGVLGDWPPDDVLRFSALLDRFAEGVRRSGGPGAGPVLTDRNGPSR